MPDVEAAIVEFARRRSRPLKFIAVVDQSMYQRRNRRDVSDRAQGAAVARLRVSWARVGVLAHTVGVARKLRAGQDVNSSPYAWREAKLDAATRNRYRLRSREGVRRPEASCARVARFGQDDIVAMPGLERA